MNFTIESIRNNFTGIFDLYQRTENLFQVIIPIFHEDGDMVDVYIEKKEDDRDGKIKILDCGMTLMKLSYSYEIDSSSKENIFNTILVQNNVVNIDGNLSLDTSFDLLYQNLMQFIGCQQKILNMRLWQREIIRSVFFDEFKRTIEVDFKNFKPKSHVVPLKDYPVIEVDYSLEFQEKPFYIFGVNNKDKAKNSAIALLEFQKAKLKFISIIIHENFEELPKKDQMYLTQNADKQFPTLKNFQENGFETITRLAA